MGRRFFLVVGGSSLSAVVYAVVVLPTLGTEEGAVWSSWFIAGMVLLGALLWPTKNHDAKRSFVLRLVVVSFSAFVALTGSMFAGLMVGVFVWRGPYGPFDYLLATAVVAVLLWACSKLAVMAVD